jgi:hypothetical protein
MVPKDWLRLLGLKRTPRWRSFHLFARPVVFCLLLAFCSRRAAAPLIWLETCQYTFFKRPLGLTAETQSVGGNPLNQSLKFFLISTISPSAFTLKAWLLERHKQPSWVRNCRPSRLTAPLDHTGNKRGLGHDGPHALPTLSG